MVAITVILAAVIGTFVLGLGDQVQDSAPNANFNFDYGGDYDTADDGYVVITHDGGQDVDADTVDIQFGSNTISPVDDTATDGITEEWDSTISTGATVNVTEDNTNLDDVAPNDDVRIVWNSPSGGSSQTIGESEVPS
jgi:FlaG/FlaF family flagellin (archaellin)